MSKTRLYVYVMILIFVCVTSFAFSEVESSCSLNFVAATTMEAKLKLVEAVKIPFLVGNNPLTEGNNVHIKAGFELSPVSINTTIDVSITPIAFLVFYTGGSIGSGWNIPIAHGLRKNNPTETKNKGADLTGNAFDGFVWYGKFGGTFQFDLAAIMPGDWNHVVIQTSHEAKYRALSSASKNQSWLYEADNGENRNGWNYYGSYVLGYQMPIFLNMVALLIEEDLYLYNTADRTYWGDDLGRWTFGTIFNFKATEKLSLALIVQGQTKRNFKNSTGDYDYYQYRKVDTSNPYSLAFYRAAINGSYILK